MFFIFRYSLSTGPLQNNPNTAGTSVLFREGVGNKPSGATSLLRVAPYSLRNGTPL